MKEFAIVLWIGNKIWHRRLDVKASQACKIPLRFPESLSCKSLGLIAYTIRLSDGQIFFLGADTD